VVAVVVAEMTMALQTLLVDQQQQAAVQVLLLPRPQPLPLEPQTLEEVEEVADITAVSILVPQAAPAS
jgi:hypothetical protein